jgi:hypothetical protein
MKIAAPIEETYHGYFVLGQLLIAPEPIYKEAHRRAHLLLANDQASISNDPI